METKGGKGPVPTPQNEPHFSPQPPIHPRGKEQQNKTENGARPRLVRVLSRRLYARQRVERPANPLSPVVLTTHTHSMHADVLDAAISCLAAAL